MYLKKIELTGFKSFAERTTLELAPGLNAVVGPNGSGKSNIADALRWVLGEQSAKQLRGGKMEDIIFAGTEHRKPVGYAEISMRLDNSDSMLPLEFKEILVARRVYRSGESEYSINGETCRLKDIQMLFMDTGVGRDGYSIIGQGRIDEILSLRSEDRRHVFEEAAGISKFKTRRGEAFSKLEREKQNRERVDDIIAELEEQLEPLAAQSEQARRFLTLRDEYKIIHVNIFLQDIKKIDEDLKKTAESLVTIIAQSEENNRLLLEARDANEKLKARAALSDSNYRRASELILETTSEADQHQGEIRLSESRIEQLEANNSQLQNEWQRHEAAITEKTNEHAREAQIVLTATEQLESLTAQLQAETQEEIEAFNQAVMNAMNTVTDSRAALLETENAYHRLEDDKEKLLIETENTEEKLANLTAAHTSEDTALSLCEKELAAAQKSQGEYEEIYAQLRSENEETQERIREISENLTASRGQYRAISALESQREGYHRSVKAVLDKKSSDVNFGGICGAVGELISVQSGFETAIEIALGGSAQNIIVQTENDAKIAIEFLKSTKNGRATFLPLSASGRSGVKKIPSEVQNETGFIGLACDLVTSDYMSVMEQLLGDILIIDSLENALKIHKKYKYSYKLVTKSGERLSPSGAITGGSMSRQTAGIVGRAAQLEKLKAEVDALQKELDVLTVKQVKLNEKRTTARDALALVREKINSLKIEQQSLQKRLIDTEESIELLRKLNLDQAEENEKLMEQLAATNAAIREAKAVLSQSEGLYEAACADLENYQKEIEQSRQEYTELRVEINQRQNTITHAAQNIERLQNEMTALRKEQKRALKETEANKAAIKETAAAVKIKTAELEAIQARLQTARAELSQSEAEKNTLDSAIAKTEADERASADAATVMGREIARLEARKENLDTSSRRLHDEIWEEYGLTEQTAQPLQRDDLADIRKRGQQLRAELSQMTNVNLGAIEAYKTISERHDFLCTQRDDIIGAENTLHELIASLTAQMESQFAEKFEEIAAHFQAVFKEMFEGGKASLRLLDKDNVLESGIEIIAQPPGKSLQNLMLLSGGERALTAITLLFAILRMKPSPFCVLDEIESALDDANVARFANFLKQYAKGTQFIIITHRKGTMEAADNLYGVTMEEQGISKLVSVVLV
ncbi:MAG: chromosome segregation protein SMC [Defluviitaleaceae bacterium]|nr:chromosome segregation protein SMC [Defluviitaleaceae bacterium]